MVEVWYLHEKEGISKGFLFVFLNARVIKLKKKKTLNALLNAFS